jgi:hypothetical protein
MLRGRDNCEEPWPAAPGGANSREIALSKGRGAAPAPMPAPAPARKKRPRGVSGTALASVQRRLEQRGRRSATSTNEFKP